MDKTYYNDKLKTLPENLRYAVIMSDWEKSLREIQSKFKLHIDQTQVLEDSTIQLMFGDIDAPDFISNMFNNAHINSETAADILLEVDLKILKKIREDLEEIERDQRETEELENILLDDEEREARAESDMYADYYGEVEKIRQETENELLKDGILPDGSNITDEMLGVTPEIPNDPNKEKDDLLNEISNPTKSFTNEVMYTSPDIKIIPTDHQIQNTQIEKPFHSDALPETPIMINKKEEEKKDIEVKKPISVNLNDIYREPIE